MKEHLLGLKKLIITISIVFLFPIVGFLLSNIGHLDSISLKDVELLHVISIGGGLILNSIIVLKEYYYKNLFKDRLNNIGITDIKGFPITMHECYNGWRYKIFYDASVNGQLIKIKPFLERGTWVIPCINIYNENSNENETRLKVDSHLNIENIRLAIQKHVISTGLSMNSF